MSVDYIIGFDSLGGHDEFSTEMLEWRIAQKGVITYSGDKGVPPDQKPKSRKPIFGAHRRNIRGRDNDEDSDSNDD